ncbi:AAA family ATPase [Clostridium sp. 19966]|uniref:SbcC/MukB-like Walker B domain-containing protein n=1 Tax=Clostridium sp. 19966 TaxID=2768166 RepID=UPI0028DDC003|nr:SbcC/MukB-like Walker B domain-containing protein [Clostridium sp. 19966]MDT8718583.1 AAA family ATPase [Clostridium sp. 19966]
MKPKKLIIKGLNSFVEEQEIDFKSLTDKGIFGIFGPTGSGKSTILDAMTIALYGSVARDTREFMNTESDSLRVSYEFEIASSGERKTYCAERILSRDKTGSYKSKHAVLTECTAGETNVIAEGVTDVKNNVEKILGLTFDDFTRSVVLPQGKFSEFLKLTGKERRNMLERLFNLEMFGRKLGDKIRGVKREKSDALNVLTGRENIYIEKGVSEESYKKLKEELLILEEENQRIKSEKESLDKEYEQNRLLWQAQKELEEYKNIENQLLKDSRLIEESREKLNVSRKAWIIKPYIDELKDIALKIKNSEESIKHMKDRLQESEKELSALEEKYKSNAKMREQEIPVLIEKETNLTRALELIEKNKELKKEREELLGAYGTKKDLLTSINSELNEIISKQEQQQKLKADYETKIDSETITAEYRNAVNSMYLLNQEISKIKISQQELEKKNSLRKMNIDKLKMEIEVINSKKDISFKELAVAQDDMVKINKDVPPDNFVLIAMKEKVFKLDKNIEEVRAYKDKKENSSAEIHDIDKKLVELKSSENELQLHIEELSETIKQLEERKKEIEISNMAAVLSSELRDGMPCPVCGSLEHHNKHTVFDMKELKEIDENIDKLKLEINVIENKFKEVSIEKISLEKKREHILGEILPLEEKYKGMDLNFIEEQKHSLEEEFKTTESKIQNFTKGKEELDQKISNLKEEKNQIQQKEIAFTEKYNSEINAYEEAAKELEASVEKLKPLEFDLRGLKIQFKVDNIEEAQKSILNREKEEKILKDKLKAANELLEKNSIDKEKALEERNKLDIEIAKILESGKEKRAVIDREEKYINELTEGREALSYIEEIRKRKKAIVEEEAVLKEMLEDCRKENKELSDRLITENSSMNLMISQKQLKKENCLTQVKQYNFKDFASVEKGIIAEAEMEIVEKSIEKYDSSLNKVRANIEGVKKRIGDKVLDEGQWNLIILRREELSKSFEENIKEIASYGKGIKDMERELEEYKLLRKEKKRLQHEFSCMEDISKLVEGNKFVEFIAMNQMKYICKEASKRLKSITGGRYALEIDSNGNFIMRDDFNGGARRSTGTLSGGETFLTSLSLALSLSSQIQLKGSAPLEFFFLDEGFGTLDTDALDTVMSSLERLHSDRLCVGIISHVEEIRNRVPVKLLVEAAQYGISGSRVKIELS